MSMTITLSKQQEKAVRDIRDWYQNYCESKQVYTLAGYAGSGKSTIIPDIVDALGIDEEQIAFAAPTGKAAKVMGQKLKDQGFNSIPRTSHSLIYQPKAQKAETIEREIENLKASRIAVMNDDSQVYRPANPAEKKQLITEFEKKIEILTTDLDRAYTMDAPRFQLNPESILVSGNIKLLVLDEGSMFGVEIGEDLMSFDIPILVMGDPGQLPPVGEKPAFDLINADSFLTEIHRQAAENPIIRIATMVRKGERPDIGDYGDGVRVVSKRNDDATLDLDRDAQVICGTNKKRWGLTRRMRKAGGFEGYSPQEGEPLIICKNSRQHPTLVNGTQMYSGSDHPDLIPETTRILLNMFDEDGQQFKLFAYQGLFEEHIKKEKGYASCSKSAAYRSRIQDNHVDFGWAITCHKSQGSQWDETIVHDESGVFRDDDDKWLYTAVTRAAERMTLVVPY